MKVKDISMKKIGVLMGGSSAEREVSLKSGSAIFNTLKQLKYNVAAIDAGDDLCSVLKRKKIDIAFIALHGGHGENGAIQGMLEVLGIPYTGSGVLASALAMDKEVSKKVFVYNGIPVPPFRIIQKSELRTENLELRTGFGMPWVVKPATEGSSIGVDIVKNRAEVSKALKSAFSYGSRVIVEKYIKGKEIQIGILNNKVLGGVEVRPYLEFYNYKAKYTAGLTEYILPPEVEKKQYERMQKVALSAHKALGCSGATRVDLILDKTGNPFVLEVNTIPGMTETSLLPKIAARAGFDFPALLKEILGGIEFER